MPIRPYWFWAYVNTPLLAACDNSHYGRIAIRPYFKVYVCMGVLRYAPTYFKMLVQLLKSSFPLTPKIQNAMRKLYETMDSCE